MRSNAERDAAALGKLESYIDGLLDKHLKCPECKKDMEISELPNSVVTLLKARYDKLRPSLSAVEQTTLNPDDKLTEEQIMAKFQQLIDAFPDLLAKLLADRAKDAPGIKAA